MPEYMEFPDINAGTTEGKLRQLTEYLIKMQEKYNALIDYIKEKGV